MTTIYIVTGYEMDDEGLNPNDVGEVLAVCTTPEAAETARGTAQEQRYYHYNAPRPLYGEVTITVWSGEGPMLAQTQVM